MHIRTGNAGEFRIRFPFGNFPNLFLQKKSFGEELKEIYNSTSEPFIGVYTTIQPALLVRDTKIIKNMLIEGFDSFSHRGFFANVKDPMADNILLQRDEKWKDARARYTPAFTSVKLKGMFDTIVDCGKSLDKYIDRFANTNTSIDVRELFARYATNVIVSVAFGIDIDCIENPNNLFRKHGKQNSEPSLKNMLRIRLAFMAPNLVKMFGVRWTDKKIGDFMIETVRQNLEYREKHDVSRRDFFQSLMQLRNIGRIYDDWTVKPKTDEKASSIEGMAAQALSFFLGGFETVQCTMPFCLYELAKHQQIQQKVYDELVDMLEKHDGQLTYEAVADMKYFERCLDESLRLHTVLPVATRCCTKDYNIPNTDIVIEKGTKILFSSSGLHHDPKYYDEPEKFKPERCGGSDSGNKSFDEMPNMVFGLGPRNCMGMRLGLLESKIGLALLLKKFRFQLEEHHKSGVCWVKIVEGKCKEPIQRNVSKESCCSAGPNVGFTEKDLNDFEYFFATAIGDGSACTSCLESCKTAKCGDGKKCIQRNDQPKCVCAPNCKAMKRQENNSNAKRTSRFIDKEDSIENVKRVGPKVRKKTGNLKRVQVFDANKDVEFVNPTNNSSKNAKSEKVIVTDSKFFNKIHGDNKKRTNFNKSIAKGNLSSVMRDRHIFKEHSKWPSMIRTGSYGYDVPFPPNHFSPVRLNAQIEITLLIATIPQESENGPYFKPVCGSDGRTYKTECQLKKRACRRGISTLRVAYKGQCQTSCKNVKCPQSMHCLEDQNLMPHCVSCATKCPPFEKTFKSIVSNPSRLVCGTDGVTYRNLCEIKRAACLLGRSIPVAYRGACNDTANCNNIKCKDRQICLNDLITHRPRCVSCSFKCSRKRKPQGKRDGKVTSVGVNTEMKLCGRNMHTYNSWCQMIKDSCSTGFFIDIEHNGECSANSTTTLPLNAEY
ncbi:putative cytochrome P450 6d5 [Pseudolycoriella hygida]|uniref:Cytochrome P450 6d5 n=1 Tax=Pseudolycoriella hygida TaxID=35572 RepID=A0A9Q0S2C6_9DIPT|nr:putative cytochrome P450 6d5 [Pseudolycoriella hygida]